ncbi:MAG TPA: glycosyltransferase [Syntrophorhabdaceae bacterium]|jgi:mannose-6-phosphate isomerase-like protein (cupin superfamily)
MGIAEFCEKAGEFELIHGFFDPFFATYAAMCNTPTLITIPNSLETSALRVFRRYNDKIRYVSFSDKRRNPGLKYIASILPGIAIENDYTPSDPDEYVLCPGYGLTKHEIAFAADMAKGSAGRLVVTGRSTDRAQYDAAIRSGTSMGTCFFESPSLAEEADLYGRACAILCPRKRGCVISPFLAAMTYGTPVVALTGGGVADLIVPGVTGFLASSAGHGAELLTRVRELDRTVCRNEARLRFSMETMIDSYARLFSTVIEQTGREDHRPWGYYEVLVDEEQYKLKRIIVYPGMRLSLQRHAFRSEHWCIVSGKCLVRCGDTEKTLKSGESIDIPEKSLHRIQNAGSDNLIFVEVQRGDYCGEDDIERFEDDYGRA